MDYQRGGSSNYVRPNPCNVMIEDGNCESQVKYPCGARGSPADGPTRVRPEN